ncbi:MAG: hypothetical protein GY777_30975 [Candidatus Brocadiaceae bacterium]|nr:hypothetical protein [Candidatus Brocadiaceae bacterium]
MPKCKRVENNPFPALIYGKYKIAITEKNTKIYLNFLAGIKKGTIIININLDIAAKAIETVDLKLFLIAQRYIASIIKNICKESQWPLAAKLIRINGLHAYTNIFSWLFPITFRNFNNKNIESTSKTRKADFIVIRECEMKSAIANTMSVSGG